MSVFQYLAVSLLSLLAVLTVRGVLRGQMRKRIAFFWLLVWAAGAITILWPNSTAFVARALGIGRGADLLLYSSVLMTFVGFFYVYTRFRRLDRQLTMLVRQLAVHAPRSSTEGPGNGPLA